MKTRRAPIGVFSFAHLLQILPISFNAFSNDLSVRRRSSASMTGIEFRSCRRKQRFKAGGVGFSRKPGDQTNTLLRLPDPELDPELCGLWPGSFTPILSITCPYFSCTASPDRGTSSLPDEFVSFGHPIKVSRFVQDFQQRQHWGEYESPLSQ